MVEQDPSKTELFKLLENYMSLGVRYDSSQSVLHYVQGKYHFLQGRYEEAHTSLLQAIGGGGNEKAKGSAKESKRKQVEESLRENSAPSEHENRESPAMRSSEGRRNATFPMESYHIPAADGVPFSQMNKRQQRRALMQAKEAKEAELDQKLPFEPKPASSEAKHALRENLNRVAEDRVLNEDKKKFLRESYSLLAKSKQKLGDWNGSVEYLRKMCEYDNEGSSVMELALALRECNQFDEAITILRRLNLVENNANPNSLYQLANMLSLNEKVDQALIYYQKAREKAEARLGGELVGGRLAREQERILARLKNEKVEEQSSQAGSGLSKQEEDDLELLFKIYHNMAVSYRRVDDESNFEKYHQVCDDILDQHTFIMERMDAGQMEFGGEGIEDITEEQKKLEKEQTIPVPPIDPHKKRFPLQEALALFSTKDLHLKGKYEIIKKALDEGEGAEFEAGKVREITDEEIDKVIDNLPEEEFKKFDFVVEKALEQKGIVEVDKRQANAKARARKEARE